MAQDSVSGAHAAKWGRETARRLAVALGAGPPAGSSNACTLNGKRVVIKCARPKTKSVGVTYLMLDGLDLVIGAFELHDGSFELLALTPELFREAMRPTASKGASAGRVGIVSRDRFEKDGRSLGRLTL